MMWNDPIVEEIRAVRENWARECGFDMQKMYASVLLNQEKARATGRKFVSFPPRRPEGWVPTHQTAA
jgi:hypothetical protein